jgi:hypothetical protein
MQKDVIIGHRNRSDTQIGTTTLWLGGHCLKRQFHTGTCHCQWGHCMVIFTLVEPKGEYYS